MVVSEAGLLREHVSKDCMSRQDATVLLTRLICELCGSYGRDAVDPMGAEPLYELPPACDVATIRAYLDELHGVRGLELARAAMRQACDGLASPMEFLIYAALAFPPRLGGLHLRDVRVNEAYRLKKDELSGLGIMRLTPDFRFVGKPIALEYQGSEHLEKYRVRKDKVRAQAYAMLGVRQYPIMIEDVSTIGALDQTLHDIVDLLSPYEGSSYRKRALSVLRDERCRRARARLLELCLRRYGADIVLY